MHRTLPFALAALVLGLLVAGPARADKLKKLPTEKTVYTLLPEEDTKLKIAHKRTRGSKAGGKPRDGEMLPTAGESQARRRNDGKPIPRGGSLPRDPSPPR